MAGIPITSKTFTRGFLGGKGTLEITPSTAGAAAFVPDQRFPDGTRDLVVATVGAGTPDLRFGGGAFDCTASFSGSAGLAVRLFQPKDAEPIQTGPAAMQVSDGKLGALLEMKAQATAAASVPIGGPAGFSFGFTASGGGDVRFSRYREYDHNRAAGPLLLDLLSDVRLPHDRGMPDAIPAADEIVQFSYRGFLELAASLNWGYALSGSEGFDLRDIQASVDYALKAKAALSVSYRLAGDFAMTVRQGRTPGFVRLIVQKSRERRVECAAGFDCEAGYEVKGLPDTPDEFLSAFLGTDLTGALGVFEKGLGSTDAGTLQQTVGKLMSGVLGDLVRRWLGSGLDANNLGTLLGQLQKAVSAYRSIDERIVPTVMDLYDRTRAPGGEAIERALGVISRLRGQDDVAKITDSSVWDLLQQLSGGDLFAVVSGQDRDRVAAVAGTAANTLELLHAPGFAPLREFIEAVEGRLHLGSMFEALGQAATDDGLAALADTTLQGLVERVLGRPFESVRTGDTAGAAKELRDTLGKLDVFRKRFQDAIQQALERSVTLRINYLYTQATSDRALLDVEIDVRTAPGQALFKQAVAGHLRDVFVRAREGGVVRVNDAVLSHELTKSSQLQIDVLGWRYKRLVEVVGGSEHSLQAHDGGLVQVFTTTASIKEVTQSRTETLQSNFVLRMAGESAGGLADDATRRFVVRTLERMSASYEILASDDLTDVQELAGYLALGQQLELAPSGLLEDLRQQFPQGFGRVVARYVVRYDEQAIRDAFAALPADRVVAIARAVARRLVSSCFVQSRHRAFLAAVGLAYADQKIASIYYDQGGLLQLAQSEIKVTLPASVTGGAPSTDRIGPAARDTRNNVLGRLFANEDALSSRLAALDRALEDARLGRKAVTVDDLEELARALVATAADMNELGGPNAFFAVIDALVAEGAGERRRESALVLEITPPGGQKITKVFMQGRAA